MIRVALIDDHKMVRTGMKVVLAEFDDIEVVFEAANAKEIIDACTEGIPCDVLLLDINLPDQSGVEVAKFINKKTDLYKIIALSMNDDQHSISSMLKAGANGYLLKDASEEEIYTGIKKVYEGGTYFSQKVTDSVMNFMMLSNKKKTKLDHLKLSKRELEILKWVCNGLTNNEISEKLFISSRTVDAHRRNLLQKTGTNNSAGLVKFAFVSGLISVEDIED